MQSYDIFLTLPKKNVKKIEISASLLTILRVINILTIFKDFFIRKTVFLRLYRCKHDKSKTMEATSSKKHHRRSIRLKGYDYSQAGLYFVTICVHNGQQLFGKIENGKMILSATGEIANTLWYQIRNHIHNVRLHEFVVMPNHVHGIIEITKSVANARVGATHALPLQHGMDNRRGGACPAPTLGTIVGSYKSAVSKHIRRSGFTEFAWQRNYFEHIIRNDHSYEYIANYIINNPTTWEKDKFNFSTY